MEIAKGHGDSNRTSLVKKTMTGKVKSLQNDGRLVSRHCVSLKIYTKRNIFDTSKNSLPANLQRTFDKIPTKYIKDNSGEMKYISPLKNHGEQAFHMEIVQ